MESVVAEQKSFQSMVLSPVFYLLEFLENYGWPLLFLTCFGMYIFWLLRKMYGAYKVAKEDAEYHKDPDKALSRLEACQRARERQQAMLAEASRRAKEAEEEAAARKREENLQRLEKYGTTAGGHRLGDGGDDPGYLPLSGGASTSTYRPQKKKCPGGGCGR